MPSISFHVEITAWFNIRKRKPQKTKKTNLLQRYTKNLSL